MDRGIGVVELNPVGVSQDFLGWLYLVTVTCRTVVIDWMIQLKWHINPRDSALY